MKRVRLKWVKNRGLDHIIATDAGVRSCCLILEALCRSPGGAAVPARALDVLRRPLALTVPVLRFLRRFPTLFSESPHPRYPSLPTFSPSPFAAEHILPRLLKPYDSPLRLARLLLLSRSRSIPVRALRPLCYDLGIPPSFLSSDAFAGVVVRKGDTIALADSFSPSPDLTVSALQRRHELHLAAPSYRGLHAPYSSALAPLAFPMRFPRGYGGMNKVKAWMEDFHRLPYISPYDQDYSGIDPVSDVAEKRFVGVLHELLSLTIHKMLRRNAVRPLRELVGLPQKFTRLFTRYPGVFYYSLKCRTSTVVLREGYERGKLVEQHPVAALRGKIDYAMRTGILYRGKGMTKLMIEEEECGGDAVAPPAEEEEMEDVENFGMELVDADEASELESDEEEDDDDGDYGYRRRC